MWQPSPCGLTSSSEPEFWSSMKPPRGRATLDKIPGGFCRQADPAIHGDPVPPRWHARRWAGHLQLSAADGSADGYFRKITFEPVYEPSPARSDAAIADAAVTKLRADIAAGFDHLMMARCESIERAEEVLKLYAARAPDLKPLLIHSRHGDRQLRITSLIAGESKIAVCVNMLGEGFDLPQLKVAAIHDLHKSLAILLQFTGRFTRSAGRNIGEATVIANIAEPNVSLALERLYSECRLE